MAVMLPLTRAPLDDLEPFIAEAISESRRVEVEYGADDARSHDYCLAGTVRFAFTAPTNRSSRCASASKATRPSAVMR